MNENNKIKAEEWFEKAKHDLATVEMIINTSGYADTAAVLLQQGTEKYLKGFLISRGWKLVKTHNLKQLLDEAVKYDNQFEKFYDLMIRLSGYYVEEKYPAGMKSEVMLEEIKDNYEKVKELIKDKLEIK